MYQAVNTAQPPPDAHQKVIRRHPNRPPATTASGPATISASAIGTSVRVASAARVVDRPARVQLAAGGEDDERPSGSQRVLYTAGSRQSAPPPQASSQSPDASQPRLLRARQQQQQQQPWQRQGQDSGDRQGQGQARRRGAVHRPSRLEDADGDRPERWRGQLALSDPERDLRGQEQDRGRASSPVSRQRHGGEPRVGLETGLALTWLGTNSGTPTLERNVSCTLVRLPGTVQMVDVGEGTPRQLQSMMGVDPAEVDGIFVTHLHGDHCFGLGSTLAMLDELKAERIRDPARRRHHIYGPPGLAELARHLLVTTGLDQRLSLPVTITEFVTSPAAAHPPRPLVDRFAADPLHHWRRLFAGHNAGGGPGAGAATKSRHAEGGAEILVQRLAPQRVKDARDLQAAVRVVTPRVAGLTEIWQPPSYQPQRFYGSTDGDSDGEIDRASTDGESESNGAAAAFPSHRTSRRWFIAEEGLYWDIPGTAGVRVRAAQLQHRVACWGYVFQELEPYQAGARKRKVVVLGDTVSSRAIAPLAAGCDVLAHEATFATGMEDKARVAQHSTGWMAGAFAAAVGARSLALTHFSARYHNGPSPTPENQMRTSRQTSQRELDQQAYAVARLVDEAAQTYGNRTNIFAASDFYTLHVPMRAAPEGEPAAGGAAAAAGEGGDAAGVEGGEGDDEGYGGAVPRAASGSGSRQVAGGAVRTGTLRRRAAA